MPRPLRNNTSGISATGNTNSAYLYSYYHSGDKKQFKYWAAGVSTKYTSTSSYYKSVNNLVSGKTYYYRVRRQCGTTGKWSCWSGTYSFETPLAKMGISQNSNTDNNEFTTLTKEDISVYPNPISSDVLTIQLENHSKTIESLELMDINGRVIWSDYYKAESFVQIPVIDLPKGVYLIRVNGSLTRRVVR